MNNTTAPHAERAAFLLTLLLAACVQTQPSADNVPRPVKVEVVDESAARASDAFVGTLRARRRADLSFESPGRVTAVLVDVGDHVRTGQTLARLDEGPANKRLDKARADRSAAAAALAERTTQLRQYESLAQQRFVSSAALEGVQTQHQVAQNQLQAADAALALAQRDLTMSRIAAPFDGEIVARAVQPHADVGAGQVVLNIEAPDALEVVAMIPDAVAARMAPGQAALASIAAPGQVPRTLPLKLDKLSARAESGSLVQAVFSIEAAPATLRSGGVVSVEIPGAAKPRVSIPAAALLPGADRVSGSVFVLDANNHRLVRRSVRLAETLLPNGRLAVLAGLAPGDLVVVAGTAFLTEGQSAGRYVPQTLLSEAQR